MNTFHFRRHDRSRERSSDHHFDDKPQYLLTADTHILQSISARAPLPKILNAICGSLDCQVGNAVSRIFLPEDAAKKRVTIAMNVALFGLHTFCSESVAAENDEPIGLLEMYCTAPRRPTRSECQLIEWAKCLAAIAITLDNETELARRPVVEWPSPVN